MTEEEICLSIDRIELSLDELERSSGLGRTLIVELTDYGILASGSSVGFGARDLELAKAAARLRSGFELDGPALALALTYWQRIRDLEAKVHELECLLPR